jgi:Tol biopolymer transport system component
VGIPRSPTAAAARALVAALGSLAMSFGAACQEAPTGAGLSASEGLVFIRVVDGSLEVMRARISDGEVRAVTSTADRSERWPYWSDGARRLVFQLTDPNDPRKSDLVLWDPETERETELTPTPRREERWPSWSPDGRSLAYAFRGGRLRGGVALTDFRERKTIAIARSGRRDFFLRPNFSPDGRLLVAQRRIPENQGSNLWILSATAPPRRLTTDPDWHDMKAWFTRDGSRIVYTRRPVAGGVFDVVSAAVGGGDLRTIAGSEANEHSARPSPSPDEIAFVSDRDGSSDVFLADLDGGSLRNLWPAELRNELAPRWSPDGERIVATSIPENIGDFGSMKIAAFEHAHVVVLDREGKLLLDTPGLMADWMPPWP